MARYRSRSFGYRSSRSGPGWIGITLLLLVVGAVVGSVYLAFGSYGPEPRQVEREVPRDRILPEG